MINVLGKVNKDNYKEFSCSDFFGYEVYLGSEKDFKYLPEMMGKLNIVSVHQPIRGFNLCSDKEIGDESFRIMMEMLSALDKNGYKGIIVVHGALFDETISSKEKHLEILAGRIDKLAEAFPKMKVSLESDVWFFNQSKSNCALLTGPDDFLELKKYLKTRLYITLDFEHVWITALFGIFIKNNSRFYAEIRRPDDLKAPEIIFIKKAWLDFLKANKDRVDGIILEFFEKYAELKSSIINFHLNGSNMLEYWFDDKTFLPLIGEHLCIKGAGDILNYNFIKNNLKFLTDQDQINIVLEIWPRQTDQYVPELKRSGKKIKYLLSEFE